jgi:acyl-CoA reductase-like NAD-dependent aldehyde dehydrogenase
MTTTTPAVLRNFIYNTFVDPVDGTYHEVVNPSTGEVIAQAPVSSRADVDRAVGAARNAFNQWSRTTPGEHARALLAIADTIEDHAAELAAIESADAGKPLKAVLGEELPLRVDTLRFLAGARPGCRRGKRPASTASCSGVIFATGSTCLHLAGRYSPGSAVARSRSWAEKLLAVAAAEQAN